MTYTDEGGGGLMAVWDDADELARWMEQLPDAGPYLYELNRGAGVEEVLESYLFDHPTVEDPR